MNARGYRDLLHWMESFGAVHKVGVEGTGGDGAGLARYLQKMGVAVIEIPTGPIARPGDRAASPTRPTPSKRPGPLCRGEQQAHPRPETVTWRPSGALVAANRSARRARIAALGQMRQLSSATHVSNTGARSAPCEAGQLRSSARLPQGEAGVVA